MLDRLVVKSRLSADPSRGFVESFDSQTVLVAAVVSVEVAERAEALVVAHRTVHVAAYWEVVGQELEVETLGIAGAVLESVEGMDVGVVVAAALVEVEVVEEQLGLAVARELVGISYHLRDP